MLQNIEPDITDLNYTLSWLFLDLMNRFVSYDSTQRGFTFDLLETGDRYMRHH